MIIGNFPSGGGSSIIKSIQVIDHSQSSTPNPNVTTISAVDMSNSIIMPFIYVNEMYSQYCYAAFQSNTSIVSSASPNMHILLRVIEFNKGVIKNIQRLEEYYNSSSALSIPITSVNISKSIIIPNCIAGTGSSFTQPLPYAQFSSSTSISIPAYAGSNIYLQVVEFN